jgi:hypothetical protein
MSTRAATSPPREIRLDRREIRIDDWKAVWGECIDGVHYPISILREARLPAALCLLLVLLSPLGRAAELSGVAYRVEFSGELDSGLAKRL